MASVFVKRREGENGARYVDNGAVALPRIFLLCR